MGLQQQRSCVPPDGIPATDTLSQQRPILQERSANWPHDFNSQSTSTLKRSRSSSPQENVYRRRPAPTGSYFTGNVHAHIGLAGFSAERSEKQIEVELRRLYRMLSQCDKYQKYREKQPVMTFADVVEKEARELSDKQAKELAAEQAGQKLSTQKDKTVWPEFIEQAFWRALVRWPPVGRKKCMHDGAVLGRNELIQDSIRRDTGIVRDRKQVSSHLQVLRAQLNNFPSVLAYMASLDEGKVRGHKSSYAHHLTQSRSRHHTQHNPASSHDDYNATSGHTWANSDHLPSSYGHNGGIHGCATSSSPYAVTDFGMFVNVDEQPVHFITRIAPEPRLGTLNVTDRTPWSRQFPEFNFLQSQTDDWLRQGRKVLVCDASIKVMTESRPNANLSITFDLYSQRDLRGFKSIQTTTRFFDSGNMAADPQFDGADTDDLKEHRTSCEYTPEPHGSTGCLRIKFGSKFWVNRMMKYQMLRHRDENCIGRSLLRLTATQDVYGIKPGKGGEAECLLTILWRFTQTRSSAEVGSMNWRAVNFDNRQTTAIGQDWMDDKIHHGVKLEPWNGGHEDALDALDNVSQGNSQFHQLSHPLDFDHDDHAYDIQPTHGQPPPQLHLYILASLQPDLERPHASASPSASTDYSQHSLGNPTHNHDPVGIYAPDPNDFDFDGGHINISGSFDPAINLSAYDGYATHSTGLEGLTALAGLDHDGYSLGLACANGNELVDVGVGNDLHDPNLACYSTKPNWQHANLISQLEQAAEHYDTYLDHDQTTHAHVGLQTLPTLAGPSPALTQGEEVVGHGLHDAHINVDPGLWNLASPYHDDAEGGASDGVGLGGRKDSAVHAHVDEHEHAVGLGLMELIERDQRARGY